MAAFLLFPLIASEEGIPMDISGPAIKIKAVLNEPAAAEKTE